MQSCSFWSLTFCEHLKQVSKGKGLKHRNIECVHNLPSGSQLFVSDTAKEWCVSLQGKEKNDSNISVGNRLQSWAEN